MTGADYIATVRLSNAANETVAEVGETCERVNPDSFDWLIAQGWIVPVARTAAPVFETAVAVDGVETREEHD